MCQCQFHLSNRTQSPGVWRCGDSGFYRVEGLQFTEFGARWHQVNQGFGLRDVGIEDREVGNEGDLL